MNFRLGPAIKVSLGLTLITLTLLTLAQTAGLIPDRRHLELESRQSLCEMLAVQLSIAVSQRREDTLKLLIHEVTTRSGNVKSAGLRAIDGSLIASTQSHVDNWTDVGLKLKKDESTSTHVQVPILKGNERWATVEVVFPKLQASPYLPVAADPFMLLILGMGLFGFAGYWMFIRRVIRELDPTSVVPDEVKSAYNTLAEGVLVLNQKGQIVLANDAFTDQFGISESALIGKKPSGFAWDRKDDRTGTDYPWVESLRDEVPIRNYSLRIRQDKHALKSFIVSSAPVKDNRNKLLGVLVTFDDVTDLERTHQVQKETLRELNDARRELQHRAKELEDLAHKDTLTGVLNRRGFMESFGAKFGHAQSREMTLCCLIIDIDHFKRVNDTYGHAVGDQVIRYVSELLDTESPEDSVVGRLGGEEFGVLLAGMDIKEALACSEQIRLRMSAGQPSDEHPDLRVKVSIGAVQFDESVQDTGDMLNRADVALYHSKQTGRNRSTRWDESMGMNVATAEESTRGDRRTDGSRAPTVLDENQENQRLKQKVQSLESLINKIRHHSERTDQIDAETGLMNRRAFLNRIERQIAEGDHPGYLTSVASIHVETIERIHEALGDSAAEGFVRRFADDLANSVETEVAEDSKGKSSRVTAIVSRIGTSEFAIGISGVRSTNAMRRRMKAILMRLSKTIVLDDRSFVLTYSIGISICPTDARSADELIRHARAARNDVRRRIGQNSIGISRANINAHSYRALWIESQLATALENDEFSVSYQPKTSVATGGIVGFEALVRWNHPKLGAISPVEFIPIAERTGFIDTLGDWVLNQACVAAAKWRAEGFTDVRVAVNLSSIQFRRGKIKDKILLALKTHKVPAKSLEIEVTESMMLHETPGVVEMMKDMQQAGVHLSLDDFGTGYSSLSILKKLPFDSIKIDKSFVGNTVPSGEDRVILASIINIAHGLGMNVVAEGVSSRAQLEVLEEIGCDEIQGFLVSPAVEFPAVVKQLRRSTARQKTNFKSPRQGSAIDADSKKISTSVA